MRIVSLNQAQAIVLLGGGVNTYAGEYNVNAVSNSDTFIRIRYAAFLAKKTQIYRFLFQAVAIDTNDSEASLMKKALQNEFEVEKIQFI